MADLLQQGEAALRQADALLRANGGRAVLLRMPAPPASGNEGEALGLATPQFQEVELTPAVFRKANSTATLLVSASAVKAIVGSLAFDSAAVLFATAAGIDIDGVIYTVDSVVSEQAMGTAYCYSVKLRPS